ncbi:hypothetical protein D3C86_1932340 [compost metagenome]
MASQTRDLPAGQVAENALGQRAAFVLQTCDLIADIQRVIVTDQAQLFDLGLQVSNWLFEIKKIRVHRHPSWVDGQAAGRLIRLAPYHKGSGAFRSRLKIHRYCKKTFSRPNWSRSA